MNLFKKHIKSSLLRVSFIVAIALSSGLYACDNKQAQGEQDSNIGTEQTDLEVDTTASGGFGGTDNSTGRADSDTSGTGKEMANDTTKNK